MALSQQQIDSRLGVVNDALENLGLSAADLSSLPEKSREAISVLFSALNANSETPIVFDPETTDISEIAETLREMAEDFKTQEDDKGRNVYDRMVRFWNDRGLRGNYPYRSDVQDALSKIEGMPGIFKDDPAKLIWLVQNCDTVIKALESLNENGYLNPEGNLPTNFPEPAAPEPKPDSEPAAEPEPEDWSTETAETEISAEEQIAMQVMVVEEALEILAPTLNTALEAKRSEISAGGEGFMGILTQMFANMVGGELMTLELPENFNVGGNFDLRSQEALQGIMVILSHSSVLNMSQEQFGVPPWMYTEAKGAHIIANIDKLKELMGEDASPEDLADLERRLPLLIDALDVLKQNSKIKDYKLYQARGQVDIPPYLGMVLESQTKKFAQIDGANDVFDDLVNAFTGFGLDSYMSPVPALSENAEGTREAELAAAYTKMQEAYRAASAAGQRPSGETFEDFAFSMIYTASMLPLGNAEQRRIFTAGMRDAIATGNGAAFATEAMATQDQLNETGPSSYQWPGSRDVMLHPDLVKHPPSFNDGGQTCSANDVIDAFNAAQNEHGREFLGQQTPLIFEAGGRTYVAAIDVGTKIFAIEEINLNLVQQRVGELAVAGKSNTEIADAVRSSDPGFALLFQASGTISRMHYFRPEGISDFQMLVKPLDEVSVLAASADEDATVERSSPSEGGVYVPGTGAAMSPAEAEALAKDRKAEEVPATREQIDDIAAVSRLTAQMMGGPQLLSPQELALLQRVRAFQESRHDGRLSIGSGGNMTFRVRGVDVADVSGAEGGQVAAYYDRTAERVVAMDLPPDLQGLHDPAKFKDVAAQYARREGENYREHAMRVKESLPALDALVSSYRTQRFERKGMIDYSTYGGDLVRVLAVIRSQSAEHDLRLRAGAEAEVDEEQPRTIFGRVAKGAKGFGGGIVDGVTGKVDDLGKDAARTGEQARERAQELKEIPGQVAERVRGLRDKAGKVFEGVREDGPEAVRDSCRDFKDGARDICGPFTDQAVKDGPPVDPKQ